MRPRLLDLFCCEGGMAAGYVAAGFEVHGVDLVHSDPRKRAGMTPAMEARYLASGASSFTVGDALDMLADTEFLAGFDAIHASPTCQRKARVTAWRGRREDHPNTLTPTLTALRAMTVPWVVENVPEAADEMRPDYLLCGTQFGLTVRRHRIFERGNWSVYELLPPCQCYRNPELLPFEHKGERAFADAMGCGWMSAKGGRQAIPPAFAEYIGGHLIQYLAARSAVPA